MISKHLRLFATLENLVALKLFLALFQSRGLGLSELLPLVEHRAETLVLFPLATEQVHE